MARGQQKEQAQQKRAEKMQKDQKSGSQKDAQKAGLKIICPICRLPLTNYNCLKEHYGGKHPKADIPGPETFQ